MWSEMSDQLHHRDTNKTSTHVLFRSCSSRPSLKMLENLSAFLPSTLTTVDIPELLKASLTSLSERKAAVQSALTEVSPVKQRITC
jgi:hypothetical protein